MSEWVEVFNKHVQLSVTKAPPDFKVRDAYFDEKELQKALRPHENDIIPFMLSCDLDTLWAAVRVVDQDGIIWTTKDKGETWLNAFGNRLKLRGARAPDEGHT